MLAHIFVTRYTLQCLYYIKSETLSIKYRNMLRFDAVDFKDMP